MSLRVAILMPSCGQRGLANLARDAIAKFTTDVPHDVYLLDHDPWEEEGGAANLRALEHLRYATDDSHTHIFIMHDDALPIRSGWLTTLLTKPLPAAAIVNPRSDRGHSAGTLFDAYDFGGMDLAPKLPDYDVAESVPCGWRAPLIRWRGPGSTYGWGPPDWMLPHSCDVALDDGRPPFYAGVPFYVHLGGGTIGTADTPLNQRAHQDRIERWIRAARKELGL